MFLRKFLAVLILLAAPAMAQVGPNPNWAFSVQNGQATAAYQGNLLVQGNILSTGSSNLNVPTLNAPITVNGATASSLPTINILGAGNRVNQIQVTNTLTATPTSVSPNIWNFISCHGDNATFIGCSGAYIQARDDSTVTAANKGVLYGLNIDVWATQDRGNSPYDDADGIVVSSPGPNRATEAIYFGHNAGKPLDWNALWGMDASAYAGGYFTGTYNFGLTWAYGTKSSTFTGGVLLVPAPASATTPILSAGTDVFTPSNDKVLISIDSSSNLILPNGVKLATSTVASLPTCNSGLEGTLRGVTDSNSTTFNAALAGGGANHVMAYCNGTGWTVH